MAATIAIAGRMTRTLLLATRKAPSLTSAASLSTYRHPWMMHKSETESKDKARKTKTELKKDEMLENYERAATTEPAHFTAAMAETEVNSKVFFSLT